jgi:aldose 1-epimerase
MEEFYKMIAVHKTTEQGCDCNIIQVKFPNFEVAFLDYGATIYSVKTLDKFGLLEEVLLKYENIEDYIDNDRHLNAIIGPTAGRIKNAVFDIDGRTYSLEKNFLNKHNLHGGRAALSRVQFEFTISEQKDKTFINFHTSIKDGVFGYPGDREFRIHYVISQNKIQIEFFATTTKPTLINLTNHAYFNLSGNLKTNILNHKLHILASKKLQLNNEMIPEKVVGVANTRFDFREEKAVKETKCFELDDPFLLDTSDINIPKATLYNEENGRYLQVFTTYPAIVCYTDNFPMNYTLAYQAKNERYMGICFETQNPPDGIHLKGLESSILKPHQQYRHKTIFIFSVR